ncbi:transcriptional regulator XRE family [Clostridium sp. CAG:632]|nr:transcriptional regulator XRE family [Clostridium sp. CAG:632]
MGEVIKKLRKRANMTQHELAELIGVKQATISLYETGKRKIDINTAQKIAIALEVSLDELFHGI